MSRSMAEFIGGAQGGCCEPMNRTVSWHDLRGNDRDYVMGRKQSHIRVGNTADDADDSGSS